MLLVDTGAPHFETHMKVLDFSMVSLNCSSSGVNTIYGVYT